MSLVISEGRAVRSVPSGEARVREAITDVSRKIEDAGWTNLSTDPRAMGGPDGQDRVDVINRARLYRRVSPLAKQAAKLVQHYALGQGVTLRPNDKRLVKRILDEFWEDPVNRRSFTGHAAMSEFVDGLFTDGDQFLVLFPDREAGSVQLATLDAAMVLDVVCDPDNWRVPLWWKVKRPKGTYNFKQRGTGGGYTNRGDEIVWYRDWRNDDEGEDGAPRPGGRPAQLQDGLVMQVSINKRGKFGESELATAVDWLKAHKRFMEDRATLSRAAASLAWRKKRRGGASDVAQTANALRTSLYNTLSAFEGNPPPASGSTIVENEGSTTEWIKTDTGGPGAHEDERMLRMMVGSGVGVANHYFGDEGNANLATATAMELPMLKMYEAWQKLLGDTIEDLIQFCLEVAEAAARIGPRDDTSLYSDASTTGGDVLDAAEEADEEPAIEYDPTDPLKGIDLTAPVDWFVDVDFPPIVQKDLKAYAEAMQIMATLVPGATKEGQRMVLGMMLNAAGVNNVDQQLDRIFLELKAAADQAALDAKNAPPEPAPAKGVLAVLPGGVPKQLTAGAGAEQPVAEASGARVRRVLASVREAAQIVADADQAAV